MYQKAEKEKTVPTDEKVTEELNKLKQQSGISAEEFEKEMKEVGRNRSHPARINQKGIWRFNR